jgi:hypothetical protein
MRNGFPFKEEGENSRRASVRDEGFRERGRPVRPFVIDGSGAMAMEGSGG